MPNSEITKASSFTKSDANLFFCKMLEKISNLQSKYSNPTVTQPLKNITNRALNIQDAINLLKDILEQTDQYIYPTLSQKIELGKVFLNIQEFSKLIAFFTSLSKAPSYLKNLYLLDSLSHPMYFDLICELLTHSELLPERLTQLVIFLSPLEICKIAYSSKLGVTLFELQPTTKIGAKFEPVALDSHFKIKDSKIKESDLTYVFYKSNLGLIDLEALYQKNKKNLLDPLNAFELLFKYFNTHHKNYAIGSSFLQYCLHIAHLYSPEKAHQLTHPLFTQKQFKKEVGLSLSTLFNDNPSLLETILASPLLTLDDENSVTTKAKIHHKSEILNALKSQINLLKTYHNFALFYDLEQFFVDKNIDFQEQSKRLEHDILHVEKEIEILNSELESSSFETIEKQLKENFNNLKNNYALQQLKKDSRPFFEAVVKDASFFLDSKQVTQTTDLLLDAEDSELLSYQQSYITKVNYFNENKHQLYDFFRKINDKLSDTLIYITPTEITTLISDCKLKPFNGKSDYKLFFELINLTNPNNWNQSSILHRGDINNLLSFLKPINQFVFPTQQANTPIPSNIMSNLEHITTFAQNRKPLKNQFSTETLLAEIKGLLDKLVPKCDFFDDLVTLNSSAELIGANIQKIDFMVDWIKNDPQYQSCIELFSTLITSIEKTLAASKQGLQRKKISDHIITQLSGDYEHKTAIIESLNNFILHNDSASVINLLVSLSVQYANNPLQHAFHNKLQADFMEAITQSHTPSSYDDVHAKAQQILVDKEHTADRNDFWAALYNLNLLNKDLNCWSENAELCKKLQYQLDLFIIQHKDSNPSKEQYQQFSTGFRARLSSDMPRLSKHRALWKVIVANLLIGLATLGIALGIKLIHSQVSEGSPSLFFSKTNRQKIAESMEQHDEQLSNKFKNLEA